MRGLIDTRQLDRRDIDRLLSAADRFADEGARGQLEGRVVGLFFYSDSLRTRVGFEVAAARLGARTFLVTAGRFTPVMSEPEAIDDAVRSIAGWCDAICVRHPEPDVVGALQSIVDISIINCGNGSDEHPAQALADLFAMHRLRGSIDGVRVAIVGDLDGMRCAHSLVSLLGRYRDVFVRCVAPPGLSMPARYLENLRAGTGRVERTERLLIDDVDFVYVAGLPRHTATEVSDAMRESLWITRQALASAPPHTRVLCPLPRIDEIARDVDDTVHAAYFEQSRLALPMRMAVLTAVMGG